MDDSPDLFHTVIGSHLDKLVEKRIQQYVKEYAHDTEGNYDHPLACRIEHEVRRRGSMGRELDVYEPIRWTAMSAVLSGAAGAGIKFTTEKSVSRPALITLMVSTAINSAIQLVRLLPRYDAGLKGGVDTALVMHELDYLNPTSNAWQARITAERENTNKNPCPTPHI